MNDALFALDTMYRPWGRNPLLLIALALPPALVGG